MMKNIFLPLIIIIFLFSNVKLFSQNTESNTEKQDAGFITGFSYGYFFPEGDMKTRFGNNFKIDIAPSYYFYNSGISIGLEIGYLFGNEVKINPISNLISYDNNLISTDYSIASLRLFERGWNAGLNIGKIISFNKNTRSGLKLEIGAHLLVHKIFFQKEFGILPQLEGEYLKGYDRMTGGFALKEFIGYQYLKQKSKINFYAGFDLFQGFTKSLRKYNYNQASYDQNNRKDYLFGFKAGWILPLYIIKNPDQIYY